MRREREGEKDERQSVESRSTCHEPDLASTTGALGSAFLVGKLGPTF